MPSVRVTTGAVARSRRRCWKVRSGASIANGSYGVSVSVSSMLNLLPGCVVSVAEGLLFHGRSPRRPQLAGRPPHRDDGHGEHPFGEADDGPDVGGPEQRHGRE